MIFDKMDSKKFIQFFKKKRSVVFGNDCITLNFEMKHNYQRCWDLCEKIVTNFHKSLQVKFNKMNFEFWGMDIEFWGAGSCDMQWIIDDMKDDE